jgi:hypothetical protein
VAGFSSEYDFDEHNWRNSHHVYDLLFLYFDVGFDVVGFDVVGFCSFII